MEKTFIQLYSFEQKKYSEIEIEMKINRKEVQSLYSNTRMQTEEIQNIRNKFSDKRKEGFSDFKEFYFWYIKQDQKCGYCGISQNELYYLCGLVG